MGRSKKPDSGTSEKNFLAPEKRAEDILLGALGFGEDARIVSVEEHGGGFRGIGAWPDGEQFNFESEEAPNDLEKWALAILLARGA